MADDDEELSGIAKAFASVPPVRAPRVPAGGGRLLGGVAAALAGAAAAGVLVRLRLRRRRHAEDDAAVDEAGAASFPASDPPALSSEREGETR